MSLGGDDYPKVVRVGRGQYRPAPKPPKRAPKPPPAAKKPRAATPTRDRGAAPAPAPSRAPTAPNAPPTARRRAAPAAAPRTAVNEPKTQCQATPRLPCDVYELVVTTNSPTRALSTDRRRRYAPDPPPDAPPLFSRQMLAEGARYAQDLKTAVQHPDYQAALEAAKIYGDWLPVALGRYDFVIDTLADPDPNALAQGLGRVFGAPSGGGGKSIQLKVATKHLQKCQQHKHPFITIKPLHSDGDPTQTSLFDKQLGPFSYCAGAPQLDASRYGGLRIVFDFLMSLLTAGATKDIEVVATSCGTRPDKSTPNRDLKALVRVMPTDSWGFGFAWPGFAGYAQEKERTRTNKGTVARDASHLRVGDSRLATESSTRTEGKKVVTKDVREEVVQGKGERSMTAVTILGKHASTVDEKQYTDRKGSSVRTTAHGSRLGGKALDELDNPKGLTIKVFRNGSPLPTAKSLEDVLKAFEAFRKAVKTLLETMKAAPQIGWKATVAVDFMRGSVICTWGNKLLEKVAVNGRYYPVGRELTCQVSLTVLEIIFVGSFGLRMMLVEGTFETGIEMVGELKLTLSADVSLETKGWNEESEKKFGATAKPQLEARVSASVAGYKVSAKVGVEGGFKLEGTVTFAPERGKSGISGSVDTLPVAITGEVTRGASTWAIEPIPLIAARNITKF